mmetsp:Transcript_48680/g.121555  ORF Transcript_48680/g.121555 Transcript_48680/m.121555 type:complete len:301 (+) Transcript_48680:37-939(+)
MKRLLLTLTLTCVFLSYAVVLYLASDRICRDRHLPRTPPQGKSLEAQPKPTLQPALAARSFKPMSEKFIMDVWREKVRPSEEYLLEYQNPALAFQRVGGDLYGFLRTNKDYARVPCVLDFAKWAKKHGFDNGKRVLTTYATDPELLYLKPASTTVFSYKHFAGESGDLHFLNESVKLDNEPFDLILLGQTLEHLYSPKVALENCKTKLAPDGLLFVSVPVQNIPHDTPYDFWRYTPMGLAAILFQSGFEIVEFGQWGNQNYENILFSQQTWPSYSKLSKPVENHREHSVNAWALARVSKK